MKGSIIPAAEGDRAALAARAQEMGRAVLAEQA